MILATFSGLDAAAAGIILVGILCQCFARKFPVGLGTSLFVFGASVGFTLAAFHHQWPVVTKEIYRICLLGALLSLLWAFFGWVASHLEADDGDVRSSGSAPAFFAWSLVCGIATAAVTIYILVLATGLRLATQNLRADNALTWEGMIVLAGLVPAMLIGAGSTKPKNRTEYNPFKQQTTMLLALIVLAVWWTSLMLPSASMSGEVSAGKRWPLQPSWWTWSFQLQAGLAVIITLAAIVQDWRYRKRRKQAWPDRLEDLVQPYDQWPGYIQTEAVIAGAILLLGVYQITRAEHWQLPMANALTALAAGVTCLFMTYRRWSANTAGLGMALTTLAFVALACALTAVFYRPDESVEYASRIPVRFNAILLALWIMIGWWHWLARFWDQQLLDGVAWTTAGRMIPYAKRTGFLLTAIAVLVAIQMAIWPVRPMSATEDDSTQRLVFGGIAILLLALQSTREARRRDSTPVSALAIVFFITGVAFFFIRLPHSAFRGWIIQYNPAILSALSLPVLALAETLPITKWRSFATPLWFLALLVLPAWALLQLIPPTRPPAEWLRPTTFAILAGAYVLAGLREHRRAFLVLAAALLIATLTDLYRL